MAEAKFGFGDAVSAVSGVSSLIKGLTTKKPKRYSPKPVSLSIAPAQADLEAATRAKNEIASQAYGAINEVKKISGSDGNAAIRGILGVNANANKSNQEVEAKVSDQYRQDKLRVSQEQNQQKMINNQIMNQAEQINSFQDQANYSAKIQTANAGVQSALSYFNSREADLRNKRVIGKQTNQAIDLTKEGTRVRLMETLRPYYNDPAQLDAAVNEQLQNFDSYKTEVNEPVKIGSILGNLLKRKPKESYVSGYQSQDNSLPVIE